MLTIRQSARAELQPRPSCEHAAAAFSIARSPLPRQRRRCRRHAAIGASSSCFVGPLIDDAHYDRMEGYRCELSRLRDAAGSATTSASSRIAVSTTRRTGAPRITAPDGLNADGLSTGAAESRIIDDATSVGATARAVVTEARSWIGTPYHHAADVKGHGVDCAMLLVRVYCDLGLVEPFDPRPYTRDWFLHRSEERYLGFLLGARTRFAMPGLGDIVLFRIGRCFAHGGIVSRRPADDHSCLRPVRDCVVEDVSRDAIPNWPARIKTREIRELLGIETDGFSSPQQTPSRTTPRSSSRPRHRSLPIPIVWGRNKIAPNLIWYANFQAVPGGSGKGIGGKGGAVRRRRRGGADYTYTADLIMALCEGPIAGVGLDLERPLDLCAARARPRHR